MRKFVLAAAVIGAFAGTAQAQTSVVLYGIADAALRWDRTSNGTFRSLASGELAGSRWGIRGSEDVGNGLKVVFNYEQAVSLDTGISAAPGTNTGFTRTAVVGLQGNWGYLRVGTDYTPLYRTFAAADPFARGTVGKAFNLPAFYDTAGTTAGIRFINGWYYDSPVISGFQFKGAFQQGESGVRGTRSLGDAASLNATYANGPILLSIAHERMHGAAGNRFRSNAATGTYDFRVVKLYTGYMSRRDRGRAVDNRSYSVGLSAPFGAWRLNAQYTNYDDKTAANADTKGYGVGLLYALSRRTDFYGSYGRFKNNAAAANIIAGGYQAGNVAAGYDPSAIEVGINHRF